MKEYNEDSYLMISGVQHFVFCRRQWGLIHVEQQWEENFFTMDGQILHEKVDETNKQETRRNLIKLYSMPIKSKRLGITGKCDLIELRQSTKGVYIPKYEGKWDVIPVEYKRGKPKINESDSLQLLAQATCLEEMLATTIDKGYIFYFETRRRQEVIFTEELRKRLDGIVAEMHIYMDRGITPKVKTGKRCRTCSLNDMCLPELDKVKDVRSYIQERIEE